MNQAEFEYKHAVPNMDRVYHLIECEIWCYNNRMWIPGFLHSTNSAIKDTPYLVSLNKDALPVYYEKCRIKYKSPLPGDYRDKHVNVHVMWEKDEGWVVATFRLIEVKEFGDYRFRVSGVWNPNEYHNAACAKII